MGKSTTTYWNPLSPDQRGSWRPIEGLAGMAEELTLSQDPATGDDPADPVSPGRRHHGLRRQEPRLSGGDLHRQRPPLRPGVRPMAGDRPLRQPPPRRGPRPVQDRHGLRGAGGLFPQPHRGAGRRLNRIQPPHRNDEANVAWWRESPPSRDFPPRGTRGTALGGMSVSTYNHRRLHEFLQGCLSPSPRCSPCPPW